MTTLYKPSLISCTFLFAITCCQAQFQSSNLPIIIINTNGANIPNEPKIMADMGIIYNGVGARNNVSDAFNNYNGKIGIEIRGSSSQMFPKKQYGIELWDANGNDVSASLLSFPSESDWILSAPYNDKSLIRDVLAYKLGRDLGHYAPRTRYCEVVLNGQYEGIYFLNEKIKRDKNRVNIAKLDPDEITGEALTGGYIIKVDKSDGDSGPGWNSAFPPPHRAMSQNITFQYEYPKWDEIAPEQKTYIQNFVSQFENSLAGADFKDPDIGYAHYINVESFVDFFITNELSKNVDGYRISTFLHKQKDSDGGKLFMGPIWDFNLGFGNVDYCLTGSPDGFVLDFNEVCSEDYWLIPFWWSRLFNDESFVEKVSERWVALRNGKFKTSTIHSYIDSVASVLNAESQQRNFQKWLVLGTYVWPNYYVGPTFQSEVSWLKQWITERTEWMDENIPLITGVEEWSSNKGAKVKPLFPNPFISETEVDYELKSPGLIQIELLDFAGKRVERIQVHHEQKGVYAQRLGKNISNGMYYFRIFFNGEKIATGKTIKH